MRWVTLDKITKDVCVSLGDTDFRQYARIIRCAALAVDEVFRNAIPIMKSEIFEVPSNLVITLPPNAGIVTKVGVITGAGRIEILYYDSSIRREKANKLAECAPEDIVPDVTFYNLNWGNAYYGEYYAYRDDPAKAGTYRYNLENGTIELGSQGFVTVGAEIVVEYKDESDEKYRMIPTEATTVIMQRTFFHYKTASKPGEAELHFRQFQREFARLKSLYLRKTLEDYIRPFQLGYHSGVK